jgi:hypothetical protein
MVPMGDLASLTISHGYHIYLAPNYSAEGRDVRCKISSYVVYTAT